MQDILLDENYDLQIANGDLVVGYSDLQHQELLLVLPKGSLNEFPNATVGIEDFLNDNNVEDMCGEIRRCFTGDGMKVNKVNYSEQTGDLNYDANYS
ncbi:MAG: oxidase [Pseudopedobacter saltans]|uniref:Oxidase n=1 Tax=Pseudopedobacter saltans TaxID=151895 RepID=A0A2W5E5Z0_9SPHI|nr:MAG: oxidase [Pseudopedobacter saltans]